MTRTPGWLLSSTDICPIDVLFELACPIEVMFERACPIEALFELACPIDALFDEYELAHSDIHVMYEVYTRLLLQDTEN